MSFANAVLVNAPDDCFLDIPEFMPSNIQHPVRVFRRAEFIPYDVDEDLGDPVARAEQKSHQNARSHIAGGHSATTGVEELRASAKRDRVSSQNSEDALDRVVSLLPAICLYLSLVGVLAGVVALLFGHPIFLLPALFAVVGFSVLRRIVVRLQLAIHELQAATRVL